MKFYEKKRKILEKKIITKNFHHIPWQKGLETVNNNII